MLMRRETLQFARGFWKIEGEVRLVSSFLTNSLLQHKSTTENTEFTDWLFILCVLCELCGFYIIPTK
ncbi:Uncharacterised protein [uncultured archaeon]|nr:Uncharacterised protein [uncultured archaeon]